VADVRVALAGEEDERQAQYLAGAFVDEDLHGVFEGADMAFEFRAVVGPVGEAFDVFRVGDPAHDLLEPGAHEFAGPRDLVEREENAQQEDEHLTHGWEYNPGPWGGGFWGGVSPSMRVQRVEIRRDEVSLSYSFDPPLSPNLASLTDVSPAQAGVQRVGAVLDVVRLRALVLWDWFPAFAGNA